MPFQFKIRSWPHQNIRAISAKNAVGATPKARAISTPNTVRAVSRTPIFHFKMRSWHCQEPKPLRLKNATAVPAKTWTILPQNTIASPLQTQVFNSKDDRRPDKEAGHSSQNTTRTLPRTRTIPSRHAITDPPKTRAMTTQNVIAAPLYGSPPTRAPCAESTDPGPMANHHLHRTAERTGAAVGVPVRELTCPSRIRLSSAKVSSARGSGTRTHFVHLPTSRSPDCVCRFPQSFSSAHSLPFLPSSLSSHYCSLTSLTDQQRSLLLHIREFYYANRHLQTSKLMVILIPEISSNEKGNQYKMYQPKLFHWLPSTGKSDDYKG